MMLYRSSTAWIKFIGLRNFYAAKLCRASSMSHTWEYYSVRAGHDDLDLLKQDIALTGEEGVVYLTREELFRLPEEPSFLFDEGE